MRCLKPVSYTHLDVYKRQLIGGVQVALKVPFTFSMDYGYANAYDFSRDLSTIVYARPSGHADLYLLIQK